MAHNSNTLVLPSRYEDSQALAIIENPSGSSPPTAVSYGQLVRLIDCLQTDLARLGITAVSSVALVIPNRLEFAALFLAIVKQRGITATVDCQCTKREFKDNFSRIKPSLVVTVEEKQDEKHRLSLEALSVRAAMELGLRVAVCHRTPAAGNERDSSGLQFSLKLEVLENHNIHSPVAGHPEVHKYMQHEVKAEDKVLMLLTSGTTGPPKAVCLSHANLFVSIRIIVAHHKLAQTDRTMIITPLHHIIGICGSLLATLFSGGTAVIVESLPANFWQRCIDYHITWFHAVPTLHRLLLAFPLPGGKVPPQLRFVRSGGSEMPADLYKQLVARGPPVLEVYGMTETSAAIFCNYLSEDGCNVSPRRRAHYPIPAAVDVKILPPDWHSDSCMMRMTGSSKTPRIVGEICVRGKSVMDGYHDNPAANAQAFLPDGYFRTGDLGTIECDGYLRLVGRIKEIINKGGEKISPAEVEHVALMHESVEDATCFRIADSAYGENIGLAVRQRVGYQGSSLSSEDHLKQFMKEHLTAFKVPKQIVFLNAELRNRTGKPLRTMLAQHFADDLLQETAGMAEFESRTTF